MDQLFGLHLKEMRNDRGVSVHDLARRTGIPEGEIQKIEAGAIAASREQILLLASHFNASENDIIKLNQLTRISVETGDTRKALPKGSQPGLIKHCRLAAERINNMKNDLSFLESRRVNLRMHVPTPALAPYIESIVYCDGHHLGREYETAVPDGTAQLQIVVGNGTREVTHPQTKQVQEFRNAWIAGINNIPITYKLLDARPTIYVRFKPGGLYAFTNTHQAMLSNCVVDANILLGPPIGELHRAVSNAITPGEALEYVERFFVERAKDVTPKPAVIDYMLENIKAPLAELAKRMGYSTKYLTKTFQKYVGIGPKSLQRIQRFSRTIRYLTQLTGNVDWAYIVYEYGYHDQAHFIKEFREFTGFSPLNYLALGSSCIHYFHSHIHPATLANKGALNQPVPFVKSA
jgi:AraC-like DNA-binding protein